ncbi:hypothetical protein VOLCADRAFT_92137 [Volvox carteri f. nagariensis]|uniref:Uncharacterized protein n=1 Tax=Volvox carteri f. nagariensis TaxID=3068 RepID=D8TYP9_VOLCA|nr:uncharacterized protein VOLCADRAFT_92137 [Volvox carteri f. nagariensis]EFJ47432.1 hypothetical protein VOLCADRAFT_92137 [Volvox carteri f. nagariensis]|eukprot:XP_002951621.1 hypothetical protein VOLCADRAFT_92137 [Volvox carteri f. nagariensis]
MNEYKFVQIVALTALATPAVPKGHRPLTDSPATSALPALVNASPPAKGHASWASLLGAPAPPAKQTAVPAAPAGPAAAAALLPQTASVSIGCDELCCLALPSDMTIADFCTFLGAHLLRLRRMRVLRRQVGQVATALASASASAGITATAPAASAPSGLPGSRSGRSSSAGGSTSRSTSGGGSGSGVEADSDPRVAGPRRLSQNGQQATAASAPLLPSGSEASDPLQCHRRNEGGDGPPPAPAPAAAAPQVARTEAGAAAPGGGGGGDGGEAQRQTLVCMVLMRMESPEAADELYNDLNGKPFSSLEPDIVCRLVHVRHVEVTSGGCRHAPGAAAAAAAAAAADAEGATPPPMPPPPGQTELPSCPVCLERLDEHVSGIVTTVCNHMFHSECLQKWADTTCPVCRYCVRGAANTSRCGVCATAVDLWICLVCGHVGCGRYRAGHAADHWRTSGHCYALELETQRVWDYVGDNYVHRLIQSKTDGKLATLDADHRCAQAGAAADKARADAAAAQAVAREEGRRRQVAERRTTETTEALRTVRQEADFLRSLNETLLANQKDFKQQLAAEKARADAAQAAVKELQEQVRDLAFFIEAQRAINDAAGGELKEGTVLPLPQNSAARGVRAGTSGSSNRAGMRGGGSEAANYVAANFVRILNSFLPAKAPSMTNAKGTTVTAAIIIGYLLTVANLGDSSAVLDTGCSILELTGSHRIQSNPDEQARLRAAGCTLAPLGFHLQGPARQGDLDAGPEVVPLPHIRQDDASIIVIDLLPSETTSWPTVALKTNPKPEKSGGLFACFRPELDEPDSRDLHTSAPGHLAFMADLDSLRVYPQMRGALQRSQIQHLATALNNAVGVGVSVKSPFDYTMHGAQKVALYRGYLSGDTSTSNGGGSIGGGGMGGSVAMPRTNSSTAVAEVASEGANMSNHSIQSLEPPSGLLKGVGSLGIGMGLGTFSAGATSDYESPVVAFSSSAGGSVGRGNAHALSAMS